MKSLSRRKFISNSTTVSLALGTGLAGCMLTNKGETSVSNHNRNHFLEGLTKQNIKITDVKVTLLSCEVPPEEQWYLDWIPERYKCWKTDSILVEVFTDIGIKGIGGCTQYGGPTAVKEYVENQIKPSILGRNPFDIEFLTPGVYRRGPMVGWAGIDSALWDIIGKAVDKPVFELLAIDHEPMKKVPVYASAGEMYDGDIWPDNLIAEALEMKKKKDLKPINSDREHIGQLVE